MTEREALRPEAPRGESQVPFIFAWQFTGDFGRESHFSHGFAYSFRAIQRAYNILNITHRIWAYRRGEHTHALSDEISLIAR